MGYTLKIGEAEIDVSDGCISIDCEVIRRDDAPAHGDPTDYTSARWPSYSAWADAMRKLGLTDLMFDTRNGGAGEFEWNGEYFVPLIQSHPGVTLITKAHAEYVESKITEYKKKHPTHRAEYPPPIKGAQPLVGTIYRECDYSKDPTYDSALCRGEWLAYWLRWAVDNCKRPVFVNS